MSKQPVDIQPNALDRAIAKVSPRWAVSRVRSRAQYAMLSAFTGGDTQKRSLSTWLPAVGSADSDMYLSLQRLRLRSRDLARNTPIAVGAINSTVTSVIGTGLSMHSRVDAEKLGLSDEQAEELQTLIEREWALWANDPRSCDASATLDFYGLQSLAFRSALESGDSFGALPMIARQNCVYSTKVQLIEADRVSNEAGKLDTDQCAMGVEVDAYGAPVKYWIQKSHPGALSGAKLEWTAVTAFGARTGRRNIVHLFKPMRPGQRRGLPYLTPVIEQLKQLTRYTDAEIMAAVVSSFFTVFITTDSGVGLDEGLDPITGAQQPTKAGSSLKMDAGAIVDLAPGEKVETANPGRPNTAFDPFVQSILRQIGVALEIPFEILIKHFSASYSASRAALLEAWRFYKERRSWMVAMFCQPIFETWFEEAVAIGRIDAPGFFDDPSIRAAYVGTEWTGDSPGQLDPDKEISAAERRIALTVSDYGSEMTELNGRDWNQNVKKLTRQRKQLTDAGISIPLPPGQQANPQQAPAGGNPQTSTTQEGSDNG